VSGSSVGVRKEVEVGEEDESVDVEVKVDVGAVA
jgi:hypothetical protein